MSKWVHIKERPARQAWRCSSLSNSLYTAAPV